MHIRFHLEETGDRGAQEKSDRGGGHVTRVEENQGKLRGVRGGSGSVATPLPHGERKQDSHAIEPGGRHWRRGNRDIHGVLHMDAEVGDMYSRWVTGEGTQPRKAQVTLHILALEIKGGDPEGGIRTTATAQSLWDKNAGGKDDEA